MKLFDNWFFNYELLNNTVLDYLQSLSIFIGLSIFFYVFRFFLLLKLNKLALKTKNNIDDFAVHIFKDINPVFYVVFFSYLSVKNLVLSESLSTVAGSIFFSTVVIQAIIVGTKITAFTIDSFRFNTANPEGLRSHRRNLILLLNIAIWTGGILFLLSNFGIDISAFITGLGIGGIAVALAAQTILGDTFNSFAIAFDKPFEVGDFIFVDSLAGTVETIGLKSTRVRSLNGEMLVFSNSDLTNSRIRNYKKMKERRINFQIGVVYETSLEQLKLIPYLIRDAIGKNDNVRFDRCHFMTYGDFSLIFDIVYFVNSSEYEKYVEAQQNINFSIRSYFDEHKIDMAFPTKTVYIKNQTTYS